MKKLRAFGLFLRAGIEVIGFLWTAGTLVLETSGIFPSISWSVYALIGFLIFAGSVWSHIYSQKRKLRESQEIEPRVEIADTPTITLLSNPDLPVPQNFLQGIYIRFRNHPKQKTARARATNIWARLIYETSQGNLLAGPMKGLWADDIQFGEFPALLTYDFRTTVDLDANEEPKCLFLAMFYTSLDTEKLGVDVTSELRTFGPQNYLNNAIIKIDGSRNELLNEQDIFVRIELQGDNIAEQTYWVRITRNSRNSNALSLTVVENQYLEFARTGRLTLWQKIKGRLPRKKAIKFQNW